MDDFLTAPQSEAGAQFVRTGSCSVPSLDADPESLAEGVAPPPPLRHVPASVRQALADPQARGVSMALPAPMVPLPITATLAKDVVIIYFPLNCGGRLARNALTPSR